MIKQDLRELRKDLKAAETEEGRELLREDIEDAIDALCRIEPDDRECK
jgi:hypothetical protein